MALEAHLTRQLLDDLFTARLEVGPPLPARQKGPAAEQQCQPHDCVLQAVHQVVSDLLMKCAAGQTFDSWHTKLPAPRGSAGTPSCPHLTALTELSTDCAPQLDQCHIKWGRDRARAD